MRAGRDVGRTQSIEGAVSLYGSGLLRILAAHWLGTKHLSQQQIEERKLRVRYANWLLVVISTQLLIVIAAFVAMGLAYLHVPTAIATAFVVGVFGDIVGMATIVVKYLFPQSQSEILRLMKDL